MKKMIATVGLLALLTGSAFAHCQIPCGIYDDAARFSAMKEQVLTIEKSMSEIIELTAKTPQAQNQLVRWVNNKEEHADELIEVVTAYFLTQRIKPSTDKYEEKLKALHGMMLTAMKAKQTVDLKQVKTLRMQIAAFEKLYFAK